VNKPKDVLRYEFEQRPETGETMPIVPGIHWLRMPLPFTLGHINLWLLEDGPGWTIVDTGVGTEEAESVWKRTLMTTMGDRPVSRVLVTHLHPDHAGCAGWLCGTQDSELWMTRSEYFLCRILAADTGREAPRAGISFYRQAGFPEDALELYEKMFGFFGKYVSAMPESYRRINGGENIDIGEYKWKVLIGNGHSPEHACLYCESENLLISGDQLLPTISSNVSVYPTEPAANPLDDWMTSLARLKQNIPEDVLVLPAHGGPFRGAHDRIDELMAEHVDGLQKLEVLCAKPRRAIDVFPALFRREITSKNLIMATGEAIAHLNYLINDGRISVSSDASNVNWYECK